MMANEERIRAVIENRLPGFADACQRKTADPVLLHQDAFAMEETETALLGMAVKYAGLHNKMLIFVAGPEPHYTIGGNK